MLRIVWFLVLSVAAGCSHNTAIRAPDQQLAGAAHSIEAGCAMCIYQMPGIEECVLAVRWDDRDWLVDGSGIDDHGDAHAPDGLCLVARPGKMIATATEGNRIDVESLVLVPQKEAE